MCIYWLIVSSLSHTDQLFIFRNPHCENCVQKVTMLVSNPYAACEVTVHAKDMNLILHTVSSMSVDFEKQAIVQ